MGAGEVIKILAPCDSLPKLPKTDFCILVGGDFIGFYQDMAHQGLADNVTLSPLVLD